MNRSCTIFLAAISAAICLACGAIPEARSSGFSRNVDSNAPYRKVEKDLAVGESRESFRDRTQEIISDALILIDQNEREGAPLDQRWYAFRRFGENLEQVLRAREVRFYGGTEIHVLKAIADQYVSVSPLEADPGPGEIRLFAGRRDRESFDLIIIGQNGREVGLKTVIRLAYLFKFMDERHKRAFPGELDSFLGKVKIYLSSTPPRQEFISFFHRCLITDPDAVIIGFEGETRAVLKDAGMSDPERYSSDSLRVNWYPDAKGKKVLLVSINGNRIFASRAGELIEAIFETFGSAPPPTLVFLGAAGAINSADLVGHIVAPTVVVSNDYFKRDRHSGKLAHIIRNRAVTIVPVKTAHVSVESMVVETSPWAAATSQRRIMTVDQELYHVINAVNASRYARNTRLFVGMFVTDNVSALAAPQEATLQQAEELIGRTAAIRREFLTRVLVEAGIIPRTSAITPSKTQIIQYP